MKNSKVEDYAIYLILAPGGKKFYIGHCRVKAVRETYRHNLKKRREWTRGFIEAIEPQRPCLFVLETVSGNQYDIKRHIVAWTKIFLEDGYESYNHPSLIEMTENLYIDTNTLYRERRERDIQQILSCKNCVVPQYSRKKCEHYQGDVPPLEKVQRKRNKEIRVMVSESERRRITLNAAKEGMERSAFVRSAAINPIIIKYDYGAIRAHTKELSEIRMAINRLVYTIEATNNYLPRDIESILNLMEETFESENELLKELRKQRERNAEILTGTPVADVN